MPPLTRQGVLKSGLNAIPSPSPPRLEPPRLRLTDQCPPNAPNLANADATIMCEALRLTNARYEEIKQSFRSAVSRGELAMRFNARYTTQRHIFLARCEAILHLLLTDQEKLRCGWVWFRMCLKIRKDGRRSTSLDGDSSCANSVGTVGTGSEDLSGGAHTRAWIERAIDQLSHRITDSITHFDHGQEALRGEITELQHAQVTIRGEFTELRKEFGEVQHLQHGQKILTGGVIELRGEPAEVRHLQQETICRIDKLAQTETIHLQTANMVREVMGMIGNMGAVAPLISAPQALPHLPSGSAPATLDIYICL